MATDIVSPRTREMLDMIKRTSHRSVSIHGGPGESRRRSNGKVLSKAQYLCLMTVFNEKPMDQVLVCTTSSCVKRGFLQVPDMNSSPRLTPYGRSVLVALWTKYAGIVIPWSRFNTIPFPEVS